MSQNLVSKTAASNERSPQRSAAFSPYSSAPHGRLRRCERAYKAALAPGRLLGAERRTATTAPFEFRLASAAAGAVSPFSKAVA
eukprot:scaffold1806_cov240-Pinguiococcus_pyrenoidosus.AAC.25